MGPGTGANRTRPLPTGHRRARRGRRGRRGLRGLVVALLLAGAVLSALPAVGDGISWVGRQVERSTVGQDPGGDGAGPGGVDPGPGGIGSVPEGAVPPAEQEDPSIGADPPAGFDQRPGDPRGDDGDDRDRDDDSDGSGRSGGGDSRGGDSSGPG